MATSRWIERMVYSLWDVTGAGIVDAFPTEESALAEVRLTAQSLGRDAALSWALVATATDGQVTAIAQGEALIDRAFGSVRA
jgi:hypothetical protein